MRRLTYARRFHRPSGQQPATAGGLALVTQIEAGKVGGALKPLPGDEAVLDLSYVLNQDGTMFFEWGSVTFGPEAACALTFSSIGTGVLPGPPDADGFSHGTVVYRVDRGSASSPGRPGSSRRNSW